MGRRSRKRGEATAGPGVASARDTSLPAPPSAQPARPRRPGRSAPGDRPPAPWGSFPLVELAVLVALVLLVWGFVAHRAPLVVGGLACGSIGGLELSIREHFRGFRSHTSLLAGAVTALALGATYLLAGQHQRYLMLPIAGLVFMTAFWLLRQAFARRSGGVGFRR